jgi:two-component system response regulator CpxR
LIALAKKTDKIVVMETLLIVDDDVELMDMLEDYLSAEGFLIERAYNGKEGADIISKNHYDAVIMDIMMPVMNGLDALKLVRSQSEVPVLMLTAKGDDIDRIVGLEIGADDYLAKPFNPRELLARIRAILRRSKNNPNQETLQPVVNLNGIEVNLASRRLSIDNQLVEVTGTELDLLYLLLRRSGHVVSKETLSQQVLGRSLERYDRSIDMHMSNLRKKLAEFNKDNLLLTVRGQGYQWSGEA